MTAMAKQQENAPESADEVTARTETAQASSVPTPAGGRKSVSQEIQLPVIVGNRYKLLDVRGGGGMAKVYRAIDQTLEREVAVKLINAQLRTDPEFDARFHREARIASQLADPHIVVVHDFELRIDNVAAVALDRAFFCATAWLRLRPGLRTWTRTGLR